MSTVTQERPLLTVTDAAVRTNLSSKTIRRHIASGELPAVRLGARIRIDSDDLEQWLQEHLISTEEERHDRNEETRGSRLH